MSDAELQTLGNRRKKRPTNEDAFRAAFAAAGCKTEAERAALLQMPRRSVNRYMFGEIDPRLETARGIARRLRANIDELWPAA